MRYNNSIMPSFPNAEGGYPEVLAEYLAESFARIAEFGRIVRAAEAAKTLNALHPFRDDMELHMLGSIQGPVDAHIDSGYQILVSPPDGFQVGSDLAVDGLHEIDSYITTIIVSASLRKGGLTGLPPIVMPVGISTFIEAVRNSTHDGTDHNS